MRGAVVVPPAGIEPALLAEPDFESGASTNSAKGALPVRARTAADYTERHPVVNTPDANCRCRCHCAARKIFLNTLSSHGNAGCFADFTTGRCRSPRGNPPNTG